MSVFHSPDFKVKLLDLDDATSVASSGTNSQLVRPDDGKIYRIVNVGYYGAAPGGAGSGTHQIQIQHYDGTDVVGVSTCKGPFNEAIKMSIGEGFTGTTLEQPSTLPEQIRILTEILYASHTNYIRFLYTNNTNVANANNRELKIIVLEFNELV